MIVSEIVNTCSHEKIAAAALASLGPDFRRRMERLAEADGLSAGAFAAASVKRFSDRADPDDILALSQAMARHDTPILAGLRHILESTEREQRRPFDRTAATALLPWLAAPQRTRISLGVCEFVPS